jgi:hypothetical protein
MSEYTNMSARQLRKVAPSLGITGASRMTKDQILDRIAETQRATLPGVVSVSLYDPAATIPEGRAESRAALPRALRRHAVVPAGKDDRGQMQYATVNIPRRERRRNSRYRRTMGAMYGIPPHRPAGLMVPAVRGPIVDGEQQYVPMFEQPKPARAKGSSFFKQGSRR